VQSKKSQNYLVSLFFTSVELPSSTCFKPPRKQSLHRCGRCARQQNNFTVKYSQKHRVIFRVLFPASGQPLNLWGPFQTDPRLRHRRSKSEPNAAEPEEAPRQECAPQTHGLPDSRAGEIRARDPHPTGPVLQRLRHDQSPQVRRAGRSGDGQGHKAPLEFGGVAATHARARHVFPGRAADRLLHVLRPRGREWERGEVCDKTTSWSSLCIIFKERQSKVTVNFYCQFKINKILFFKFG